MDLGLIQTTKHYWNVKSSKMQVLIFRGFFFYNMGWHTEPMNKDGTSL